MKHLLRPALGAVLVLVVAACADPSGQSWTPPPAGTPAAETAAPESAAPQSAAPAESAAPATAAPASVAPSTAPSAPASVVPGEGRVIELELDGALQIKQNGQKITDIPVTPGETVIFKLNNTAGYAHNFWIGTDQELSVPNAATPAGVPDWNTGVQEFSWVVPDDVTGLKFGCTVPGHYSLMQGTFSVAAGTPSQTAAPASAAPASAAPGSAVPASAAPSVPAQTGPVELTFNADGQLQRNGAKVTDIPVTPGETVEFIIVNESGKSHSFYIGPSQSLLLGQVDGLVGLPEWSDAEPKQLSWEVPADITGLKFASTVGSDYGQTNGTFSIAGGAPAESAAPATAAPASVAPSTAPSAPASVVPGEGRVIEIEMDAALQIKQNGQKITDIPVTPGETIVFKLTNTAGYIHNFWIGTDQQLMTNQVQGLPGVPDWSDTEPREFTWIVPDDISGLKYGCTVPGHYSLMQGTFSVAA